MTLATGDRLGSYEVLGPLGAGGMGQVFRARDGRLEREVAIKVLPPHLAQHPDALARFEREAKAVAALSHPNILAIFDVGKERDQAYAVMELLEGQTLRERLREGALPARKAVEIAVQIAAGLAAAHERGIVHRDLKPENVFVLDDGRVKILDFGLAKQGESPGSQSQLMAAPTMGHDAPGTEPGAVLGTVGYMAPEQVKGQPADARSDLFALGVILYEMLTGRRAFARDSSVETMSAILKEEPPELDALAAKIPPALDHVLRRCVEKNPSERFQSARDLAFALRDSLGGSSTTSSRAIRGRSPLKALGPLVAAAAAGALVAFFAARASTPKAAAASSDAPRAMRFQQLTDGAGVEASPTLSPDGKDVAFCRMVDGRSEIHLQHVGARIATQLTGTAGTDDRQPVFSPDGERIAFRSDRDGGGIFIMDRSGESVRRISDAGFYPTWSPDGGEIAAAAGDFQWPTDRGSAVRGLFAINIATGARRELSKNGDIMQPRWSPHGQRIAYWGLRLHSGQRDLYTVAADGSDVEKEGLALTNDTALDWSPEWSPDGRWIYFSSNRGGTMNVWRVGIDEASGASRGEPEPVTTPSTWAGNLSFSRDGKRFAYGSLDWKSTLFRAELDPAHEQLVGTPTRVLPGTQAIRDHQVSPDGEWLVWNRVGEQEDIFMARIDGSQSRRLTDDAFRDRGPSWSPDGQRIIFYSDRSGSYQLWWIRADGSGLEQLTDLAQGTTNFPTWSPDGKQLAFSIIPGGGQTLDISAGPRHGEPVPLVPPGEGRVFWPFSWSRDGRRLVGIVVRSSGEIERTAIYDLATRKTEPIAADLGHGWRFALWLSDSRRILVREARGIFLLDPEKGEPKRLVSVGGYFTGESMGITRDDRWLTWTEAGTEGDVWLAELE